MPTFEYTETYDNPASSVFSRLIDLKGRDSWIKGIMEIQVTPEGPAQLGTKYFESGKYSGFKSEKNNDRNRACSGSFVDNGDNAR